MKPPRNYWPLGIVLAFGVFLTGTAALITFACTQKVDLVTPDYYEQEIKFQRQLDRLQRTAHLSDQARVTYDGDTRRLLITLPAGHAGAATTGRVQGYRPSAMELDRQWKLELDAHGAQSVDAATWPPGLWKIRIQWTVQNQEYFTDQSVVVGPRTGTVYR